MTTIVSEKYNYTDAHHMWADILLGCSQIIKHVQWMQYSDNQWGRNFEKFSGKGITDSQINSVIGR